MCMHNIYSSKSFLILCFDKIPSSGITESNNSALQ